MKRISFWAREHKNLARAIIVLFYLLLHFTGLFLGDIIHSSDIQLTQFFYQGAIVMTLFGWVIYPSKKIKHLYKNFFIRQKFADLILVSATFLFIVYAGNSLNSNQYTFRNPVQAASILSISDSTHFSPPAKKTSLSKKNQRKNIREEFKRIRKAYKESSKLEKTFYIILASFIALILIAGISFLGCNISCTGSEALGAIVLYGGTALVIFLLARVINRIKRGYPKERET